MKTEEQNTENEQLCQTPVSDWPLNFEQALDGLLLGKRICHRFFFDWEWVELYRFNRGFVLNEEGMKISIEDFKKIYEDSNFKEGWAFLSVDANA